MHVSRIILSDCACFARCGGILGYRTYDCPVAGKCGGCEWLAVPYPIQLERKQHSVEALFSPLLADDKHQTAVTVRPILGMDEPLHYREKVISPLVRGRGGEVLCGLYARGSHRVVACDGCLVTDAESQAIVTTVAALAKSFRLKPYDEDAGTGLLRHVLVRCARGTGQHLVTLVTTDGEIRKLDQFISALVDRHPSIKTVVRNYNTKKTNAVLGTHEKIIFGPGYIEDVLNGATFRISSRSFYQTNALQTAVLYDVAVKAAKLAPGSTVLDAYCGIGTIGILAARAMLDMPEAADAASASTLPLGNVIGVELNGNAVHDARENAKLNELENVSFVCGDAGEYMDGIAGGEGQVPDVVFLDPPRSGASEKFLRSLARLAPARVVYISCNPETQVRDVRYLMERGYTVDLIQPVDMFPHTKHIENVVALSRVQSD